MSSNSVEKLPYSTPETDVLTIALESAACGILVSGENVNRQDDYGNYHELDEI